MSTPRQIIQPQKQFRTMRLCQECYKHLKDYEFNRDSYVCRTCRDRQRQETKVRRATLAATTEKP